MRGIRDEDDLVAGILIDAPVNPITSTVTELRAWVEELESWDRSKFGRQAEITWRHAHREAREWLREAKAQRGVP